MEHRKRRVCLCCAQGKQRCEDQEAPTRGERLQTEGLHKVGTKEKHIVASLDYSNVTGIFLYKDSTGRWGNGRGGQLKELRV